MSAGFRAGQANDGYLQINGTDILTISSGVLGVKNTGVQSEVRLYCESNNAHYASLKSPPHSDFIGNVTFTLPGTSGSSGQVLQTDGSGNLSWVNQSGGGGGGGVSDKMSEGNTEAEVVDTGSDGHFKVTTEGVERLRVDSDGNSKFISNARQIILRNDGTAGLPKIDFRNSDDTGNAFGFINGATLDLQTGGTTRLQIDSSGEIVSHNGTLRRDVSNSSFTVTGDTASNTGANINLYGASHSSLANVFRVRTGATERLRVGPSGQIGIGGANYGTSGQVLTSGGASGAVSWTTISGGGGSYGDSNVDNHLNSGGASSGQILSWNGSDYAWVADQGGSGGGGISDVVDDTTPQLGGNLDLNNNNITGTGTIPAANLIGTLPAISGANLTNLDASDLASGTIPDARFPATLPSASGANLTNLDASDLASGTIPDARFPATLPSASGANLTNLPAANLTGTLPAISGANLTNLPSDTPADTDVQVTYDLSANGSSAYRFTGPGYSGADDNPDLYLVRGQRYRFINATGGHPFRIQSNTSGTAYTDGVSGSQTGTQDFNVQYNAPERLYYQCTSHSAMIGNIYIVGASDWRMTDVATSATPKIFTNLNVGIGTDNPSFNLHVSSDSNTSLGVYSTQTTGDQFQVATLKLRTYETSSNTAAVGDFLLTGKNTITFGGANRFIMRGDTGVSLGFYTNNTERLSITSAGLVGIGTDNPDELLEVGNGTVVGGLKVSGQSSNVTSDGLTVDWESSSNSTRIFSEPSSGGSSVIRLFTTNSGTRAETLRIQSGGGISFNGDTAAANALDDYEEGTWTPTMSGATLRSQNLPAGAYPNRYTKIGRQVTLDLAVSWATITGTTELKIAGLPFTATKGLWGGGLWYNGWSGSQPVDLMFWVGGNTTYLKFYTAINGGVSALTQSDISTTGNIYGSITYFA